MLCPSNNSLFGSNNQYIKFQNGDIVAIQGANTVERLITQDVRINYKQLLKSRIILKPGQTDYLLNHLGMGDNATFIAIKATYNQRSVNEELNYILWSYSDDPIKKHPMKEVMILTGNSTNRIKQLFLNNPNENYEVILDVMVASIDDTYTFFTDTTGQTGTTFTQLTYEDIRTFVIDESIVVIDSNGDPLIYIQLSNINSITRNQHMLTLDDNAFGTIILVFDTEENAAQTHSKILYAQSNSNINLTTLPKDTESPVITFRSQVGGTGEYISLNGATAGVPYDTSQGLTFSTEISLTSFGLGGVIDKNQLITLLIDNVSDNRDGLIAITQSAINISASQSYDLINATGSYTVAFDVKDIALNDVSDVVLNLSIIG